MPKRTDIHKILLIGSGPIVVGQACEFDYSGAQVCKALRSEGYSVVLLNSNPATVMTDMETADVVYLEPITEEVITRIIEKERPDALFATVGGQTALNIVLSLDASGVLEKYSIELLGIPIETIHNAEDRGLFKACVHSLGLETSECSTAQTEEEAWAAQAQFGFPCIVRPSFSLGGTGGGIAYNKEEFHELCQRGFVASQNNQLLIDESLIGWKEYETEVLCDSQGNAIALCSIENIDPMGIHTGDSMAVSPAQTLTDQEYQRMRQASFDILRAVGVQAGGANVQFAIHPETGRMVVVEMNPRLSRSSALASKATGFPIAKISAKLAVGYHLDELFNDLTGEVMPASFEPVLDYVVVKMPRFSFEKFPASDDRLTTQMKSIGEVMGIGFCFQEALQKALNSLEIGATGLNPLEAMTTVDSPLITELKNPGAYRIWAIGDAFRAGYTVEALYRFTKIDPWFLRQIQALIQTEQQCQLMDYDQVERTQLLKLKKQGFTDARLAQLWSVDEALVREKRIGWDMTPCYKRVDTCAAEFDCRTAYLYSTYFDHCEMHPSDQKKVIVLGSGPNRIGQGIEFDCCSVHAVSAARALGYETIVLNCNPETVSTDYDVSDRLYCSAISLEAILDIVKKEKPVGIITQCGGQTPLKLSRQLERAGVHILGTSSDAIDRAEDRHRFQSMIHKLGLKQPVSRSASSAEEALSQAIELGYPLLVRPSYIIGGQSMRIVANEQELIKYLHTEQACYHADAPILLDRFLNKAIEADVDCISDGQDVFVAGVLQHIEQAGIHSGDSYCSFPAYSLSLDMQERMKEITRKIALELGIVGHMNVQLAVQDNEIYVIEANPRASRTVPFLSKCLGISLAGIAAQVMLGHSLASLGVLSAEPPKGYFFVKGVVTVFEKFPNADPILGPEMQSTGEVIGIGSSFGAAFLKAQLGAGKSLPKQGKVILSVRDADKEDLVGVAQTLVSQGFQLVATGGTARSLQEVDIPVERVNKVYEGRPNIIDYLKNMDVAWVINTTEGTKAIQDSAGIRRTALQYNIHSTTTMAGVFAVIEGLQCQGEVDVVSLQSLHQC